MGNFMSCVLICGAMEVVQVVNTNGRVEKLIRPIRAAELIWAHERYKAALAAGLNPSSALSSSDSPPSKQESLDVKKSKPTANPPQTKAPPRSEDSSSNKFVLLPLDPSKPTSNIPVAEVGCRAYNFQCLSEENVSVKHVKKARSTSSSTTSSSSNKSSSNNSTNANNNTNKQQGPGVNSNHPPFRVKKEGGVTTLVVSKRYLEQLLSEKELKASNSDMAAADILRDHNYLPKNIKHSARRSKSCSSSSGRVSIWRPALESISEGHNNNNNNVGSTSAHHLSLHHQQQQLLDHHHHQHHHHRHHHQQQIRQQQ